jgi:hypothetical protein
VALKAEWQISGIYRADLTEITDLTGFAMLQGW